MLLTVPFLISICISGLFLIAGIVLKSLGYLFSFAPKLAKKNGTTISNILDKRKAAPHSATLLQSETNISNKDDYGK